MKKIILLVFAFVLATAGIAQTKKASGTLGVQVAGTSTMHDWAVG